ncbi:hypothetical protein FA15DRAFT_663606 [Coprinopsis marcescibilis]|uniref:Uncharacterized protein n=1 Tax=Coprinopsis marcescibilis TaxID=230819 RepID=A0A5C3LB03_COPMA|nr:hypothetical protein FA15DRAFT_663606 [Coprinopsis marcescibilis]
MYQHHLDSPPPPSRLYLPQTQSQDSSSRASRPWSPDGYQTLSSNIASSSSLEQTRQTFNALQRGQFQDDFDPYFSGTVVSPQLVDEYPLLPEEQFPRLPRRSPKRREERQEASEVSVEALDLADYARTLRSRQMEHPYPPFPYADVSLNSSSARPLKQQLPSHPPSSFPSFPNIYRGGTRSSANTSTTSTHRTPNSIQSMPLAFSHRQQPLSVPNTPNRSAPNLHHDPDQEIDVTHFPAWSRDWYNSDCNLRKPGHTDLTSLEAYEREVGLVMPPPLAGPSSSTKSRTNLPDSVSKAALSPFDPAYIHPESYPRGKDGDMFNDNHSYPSYSAPPYSNHEPLLGYNDPRRDGVVPWSLDPPEYKNMPLDPQVKEDRIRMLEHEFGTKKQKQSKHVPYDGKSKEVDDGLLRDDNGKIVVGTPNGKGGLATRGPKMRATARFLQFAFAIAVGGPVVWAALALKPDPAPPPAGTPPFYILAVLSPITFLVHFYFFLIRPCVVRRRQPNLTLPHPGAQGMMVLPVQAGGKRAKGGKGHKHPYPGKKGKKRGYPGGGDVQVNLIVDPNAFGLQAGEDDLSSSSDEGDGGTPGSVGILDRYNPFDSARRERERERNRTKRKRNRRKTLLASLKLEEEWRHARSWLRIVSTFDAFAFILWGVAFGFVLAGKRCPTGGSEGGYGGWCTAYNASTAAACLLCIAFGVSLFFDVQDVYASKASPRTRV